jgi:hypothetical protein
MSKYIPKYTIRGGRVIQVREGLTDLINVKHIYLIEGNRREN